MNRLVVTAMICIALGSASAVSAAETDQAPTPAATEIANRFLERLKTAPASDAYALLFQGTNLLERKAADIGNLANQTDVLIKYYGKITGYEFVSEDVFSSSVLRQRYVMLTDTGPLFWNIYFYKGRSGWTVNTVYVDDKITEKF